MKMFADLKEELLKRELSNAENFDKAILARKWGQTQSKILAAEKVTAI